METPKILNIQKLRKAILEYQTVNYEESTDLIKSKLMHMRAYDEAGVIKLSCLPTGQYSDFYIWLKLSTTFKKEERKRELNIKLKLEQIAYAAQQLVDDSRGKDSVSIIKLQRIEHFLADLSELQNPVSDERSV